MAKDNVNKMEEVPLTLQTLRDELQLSRQASLKDFKAEIVTLRQDLCKDIEALRTETISNTQKLREDVQEEIVKLQNYHKEATTEQASMGHRLNDALEQIARLESEHGSLSGELKRLQEKCTDLESRSRRQNLRIVGVPEGVEGANLTRFLQEFLSEVLGPENFTSPPVIDRAHRSLALKPKKGERPRPIIARLHYFAEKERILGISRGKGRLLYQQSPVHIFPDLPAEVSKLRAAFNPVKAKLREAKMDYSLFFPAVLSVNIDGVRHKFNTPEAAEKFFQTKIAPNLAVEGSCE